MSDALTPSGIEIVAPTVTLSLLIVIVPTFLPPMLTVTLSVPSFGRSVLFAGSGSLCILKGYTLYDVQE